MIKPTSTYEIVNLNSSKFGADYHITLRITEACDLQCSYCHWHSGKHYSYETIIASIDKLFEFFQQQKFKRVMFYYHGGEATRHNRIVDILKHVKHKAEETGIEAYNEMQTNLTIKTELLEEIVKYSDMLDITFHYMELNKREYKMKAFETNFKWIEENNIQIHNFDVMLESVPVDVLPDFYKQVERYMTYRNMENSEMIYGFYEYDYNEDTVELHKAFYSKYNKTEQQYRIDGTLYNTNQLFKESLDCTGWKCSAGKSILYVNGDGNVFVCAEPTTRFVKDPVNEKAFTNLVTEQNCLTKLTILCKSGTICKWNICGGDFYLERSIT